MEREALKLALEILDVAYVPADLDGQREKAITAIKEALAQPAQEPLAWMCSAFDGEPCEQTNHDECGNPIPLYTTPPQREWVGLTDEEINKCAEAQDPIWIAKNVEAKLKERNS